MDVVGAILKPGAAAAIIVYENTVGRGRSPRR